MGILMRNVKVIREDLRDVDERKTILAAAHLSRSKLLLLHATDGKVPCC